MNVNIPPWNIVYWVVHNKLQKEGMVVVVVLVLLVIHFVPMVNVLKFGCLIWTRRYGMFFVCLLLFGCVSSIQFQHTPLISSNIHTGTSRHKGCDCNSGFEGDYCEYIYGEGPVWKTNTGAAISWVISIVVFGIVAVSIKIYHAKQSRENDQRKIQFTAAPADLNDDDDDLEMVHDGEEDYKCQNKEIS